MQEGKFCINCKHSTKRTSGYYCQAPKNYRNLVTGELIIPLCMYNRCEDGPCGEEGLLFESKEGCSYA